LFAAGFGMLSPLGDVAAGFGFGFGFGSGFGLGFGSGFGFAAAAAGFGSGFGLGFGFAFGFGFVVVREGAATRLFVVRPSVAGQGCTSHQPLPAFSSSPSMPACAPRHTEQRFTSALSGMRPPLLQG